MSQDSFFVPISIPNVVAGTVVVFQAPAAADAGGVTIDDCTVVNSAAGTITFTLLKYSNAASPALNGTVASTGGTIVAGTPLAFAIGPNNYISAGEYVKLAWSGNGTPAADASLLMHYKMGREAV